MTERKTYLVAMDDMLPEHKCGFLWNMVHKGAALNMFDYSLTQEGDLWKLTHRDFPDPILIKPDGEIPQGDTFRLYREDGVYTVSIRTHLCDKVKELVARSKAMNE